MASTGNIHWLDYLVVLIMLLMSCAIGIYYACKKQNQAEYLMGSRQMHWWAVALSLTVTFYSGISQIGKPAEIYLYGIQFSLSLLGMALAMIFSTFTFLPLLYKLKLTSSYEYLEVRFNSKAVRQVGSLSAILSLIVYSGIAMYVTAMILGTTTGLPVWTLILCTGAVTTFYTMLGGLKAVVWVDTFQYFIMMASAIIITVFGLIKVGGWTNMWEICEAGGRINFYNFDPDPLVRMTFWSVVFGMAFTVLPIYTVNQACVQRLCSVPTLRQAKLVMLSSLFTLAVVEVMTFISGLLTYSYFSDCDPLNHPDPAKRINSPNELIPLFVMNIVNIPGLLGIFMASILSGSLSTVSSILNALAALTWEDFLMYKLDYLSGTIKANILKVIVLVCGSLGTTFAFITMSLKSSVLQVGNSFAQSAASPLLGMFFLGAFFKRANWLGSIVGSVVALVFTMWISIGSYLAVPITPPLNSSTAECVWNATNIFNLTADDDHTPTEPLEGIKKLYSVSYFWFPAIGTWTTVAVGIIVSLLTAPFIEAVKPENVKENHIIFCLDFWSSNNRETENKKDVLDETELSHLNA